tara:strand:+ start:233 stop:661 length:429 start_codon:yes stop_codon:yes gene_type:complete
MDDQENIKRLQARDTEWKDVKKRMEEGADKTTKRLFNKVNTHLQPKKNKTFRSSLEIWEERYPDLMMLEPREFFDEAIVGVVGRINLTAFCYDTEKVLDIVEKRVYGEGCSPEEALEHFEFNIRGSYVGEHSPVFLDRKVDL